MQITCLGHAGLHIETRGGTILCDPWKNPAYFDSWFVFPDNGGLDWDRLGKVDYLYVSHLHQDHFDPELLSEHVSPEATVLLPDFPVPDLRDELERLGFTRFTVMPSGKVVELDGLRLMAQALQSPADGPLGDSALAVDDGTARILDQNDARPTDLDPLRSFGRYDVHLLQFSGAIWWPWAYELPEAAKRSFGAAKRADGAKGWVRAAGRAGRSLAARRGRPGTARSRRRGADRHRFPGGGGPGAARGDLPLPVQHRPSADRAADRGPPGRLGQQPVPEHAVPGAQGRAVQRVPVHVLQVPGPRPADVRGGLVRRQEPRRGGDPAGRLDCPAPVPASARRPQPVRRDPWLHPHVHDARMAVRPVDRPVSDDRRRLVPHPVPPRERARPLGRSPALRHGGRGSGCETRARSPSRRRPAARC